MGKIDVETLSLAKSFAGTDEVKKICLGETELWSATPPISFPNIPYKASWTDNQVKSEGLQVVHSTTDVIKQYAVAKKQGLYCAAYPNGNMYRICFMSKDKFTASDTLMVIFYNGSSLGSDTAGYISAYSNTFYIGYIEVNNENILESSIPYYAASQDLLHDAYIFFS